ncbi:protein of unknown function [Ectopseudomonas composti]|uniref:DUF4123 domain-containing protein n=1 Tax=Ectopseudomonas composti TaxID=658457 RepID=A0A1I5S404_9GAMM|nr:protein of unknown function [Pseudomonas composti]
MPTHDLQHLPSDLPWDAPAYLLLDGVSVENLPKRLYEWAESPDFDVLYLETPWAELSDVSPCLIRLGGQYDPALAAFMQSSHAEWGYLLFSHASRDALLKHLRWLLCVSHPLGEKMLLRLADPAVMHALLNQTTQDNDATLSGPLEQIVAADRIENVWHRHQRPGSTVITQQDRPYQLSDNQLDILGEVAFRNILISLDAHMRDYFPHYQTTLSPTQRWQHLRTLAERAYSLGFSSEYEITLYANLFGLLGDDALDRNPDIATLVNQSSPLTPTQRIEQAADLAYARASSAERTS